MNELPKNDGLDLAGFGKIASAIPKEVYERSAVTLLTTFEKLTAPITETTGGLGRYLRQKFDNMVEAEKAIATYTLEKALVRAKAKSDPLGIKLQSPTHPKTFVRTIEEASQETDPLLHEMWTNLLASQLSDDTCHPHFVEILTHFSPEEAKLLVSLLPRTDVGENEGGLLTFGYHRSEHWVRYNGGEINPWSLSCDILVEFHLADILGLKPANRATVILYRTTIGDAFLNAVSPT